MIYSELGPTATGKSNTFVPGGDDRIEYAELDHRRGHVAASDSARIATSSLTIPDREPGTFGIVNDYNSYGCSIEHVSITIILLIFQTTDGREDSPTPPPLPPKYECYYGDDNTLQL